METDVGEALVLRDGRGRPHLARRDDAARRRHRSRHRVAVRVPLDRQRVDKRRPFRLARRLGRRACAICEYSTDDAAVASVRSVWLASPCAVSETGALVTGWPGVGRCGSVVLDERDARPLLRCRWATRSGPPVRCSSPAAGSCRERATRRRRATTTHDETANAAEEVFADGSSPQEAGSRSRQSVAARWRAQAHSGPNCSRGRSARIRRSCGRNGRTSFRSLIDRSFVQPTYRLRQ